MPVTPQGDRGTRSARGGLLRQSLGLAEAAGQVERAVRAVLAQGYRTADIAEPGGRLVGTEEMGAAVAAAI